MTALQEQAEERLLDAMLDEAIAAPLAARAPRGNRWLAAALMLLGIGVAVGVALMAQPAQPVPAQDPAPAPADPLPPATRAEGRAALEDLRRSAPSTRNLWCVVEPEDVALLADFAAVEKLVLEPRIDQPIGKPDGGPWDLAPLQQCRKLRSLTLGILPSLPPAQLAHLRALPALTEFGLTGTSWILDEALADEIGKLAVRSLKLAAVRCAPAGLQRLCEHPLLEELELWNALFLRRCDLTHFGKLRQLRRLSLIGVGDRMADAFERENPMPGDPPREPDAAGVAGPAVGSLALHGDQHLVLTPRVMQAIAGLPGLVDLDLRTCVLDAETLAKLPRELRKLGLQGVFVTTTGALDAIGDVRVDEISASVCQLADLQPQTPRSKPDVDPRDACQDAICKLIRRLQPRVLRFEGWMTEPVGDLLESLTNVEKLEFSHVGSKLVIHTATIAKMTSLRVLRLRHVPDAADPEPLLALPHLREVHLIDATPEIVARYRQVLGDKIAIHVLDS